MKPAFSVIFLTTLIGMGQGLFVALYCAEIFGWVNVVQREYFTSGAMLSLACLIAGLMASFFHLGRPERAWRAAAMWRTSWLSREVIALPFTMMMVAVYGYTHYNAGSDIGQSNITLLAGGVGIAAVIGLFICTAMIYACIKFLQEWASPLTVINFTLLGLSSGFVLSTAHASYFGVAAIKNINTTALLLLVIAFIFKLASLWRNQRIKPKSTTQTAIGIRHNKIKQQSVGFMGGSFNTKAFFHGKSQSAVKFSKLLSLVLVFLVPGVLLLFSIQQPLFTVLVFALVTMYIGLIAERWHFFVQANHPQNLYYQSD